MPQSTQILSIEFSHPEINNLYKTLPTNKNINQNVFRNLNSNLIENTIDQNGNPVFFTDYLIPSPSTDLPLTLTQLKQILRTDTILNITILEINFLDPTQSPIFVSIPNHISNPLLEDLSIQLEEYIYHSLNKHIFLLNNQLPCPSTGLPITPNDIRHLIYHRQPLTLSFKSTPEEIERSKLQMLSDNQIIIEINYLQEMIHLEKDKIQNDTPYDIEPHINYLYLKLKKYNQEKQKRKL